MRLCIIRRLTCVLLLLTTGCASIGSGRIPQDRFDYSSAIGESWKHQMLINIVKHRYADSMVFLDIASVISQYQVSSQMSALFSWNKVLGSGPPPRDSQSFGVSGSYVERPTITYNLLSGHKFSQSLMTPIPPAAIISVIQAGWPAELVMRLTVKSINGIMNYSGKPLTGHSADTRFYELIEALGIIQRSGAVGIRVKKAQNSEGSVVMVFNSNADATIKQKQKRVRELLGLNPEAQELALTYGLTPAHDREIAILSLSMLDILTELSGVIEVPEQHVREKRTYATRAPDVYKGQQVPPLLHIQSGLKKPADALVAIPYRNYWFWIDDREFESKRIFGFLMFIITLTETPTKENVPIVTIPTG